MAASASPSCRSAPTSHAGSWRRSTRTRGGGRRHEAVQRGLRRRLPLGHIPAHQRSRSTSRRQRLLAALDASGIARGAISADAARRGLGRTGDRTRLSLHWPFTAPSFSPMVPASRNGGDIRMKSILAVLMALAISTPAAFAGEITDRAAEAEKALQAGDGAGALEKFRSAEEHCGKRCRSPCRTSNRSTRPAASASTASVPITFTSLARRSSSTWNLSAMVTARTASATAMIALSVDLTVLSKTGEVSGHDRKDRPHSGRFPLTQPRAVLQTRPLP